MSELKGLERAEDVIRKESARLHRHPTDLEIRQLAEAACFSITPMASMRAEMGKLHLYDKQAFERMQQRDQEIEATEWL